MSTRTLYEAREWGHNRIDTRTLCLSGSIIGTAFTDLLTTFIGIRFFGLVEIHPIGASIIGSYGFPGMVLLKAAIAVVMLSFLWVMIEWDQSEEWTEYRTTFRSGEYAIALAAVSVWGFATVNNLWLILTA